MQHTDPRSPSRTIIPLLAMTGVSLLATDIYLPSIPHLPTQLGGTFAQAQATLPAFFVTFALCQLLHGALADTFGKFRVLIGAAVVFLFATVLAAMAPDITILTIARALQGVGAAAATAIVPAVIRSSFNEATSIRLMSWLGMAESLVPALGPFLGAYILLWSDWRANFWLLAICGVLSLFMLLSNRRIYSDGDSVPRREIVWSEMFTGYRNVIQTRAFLGYALGYASAFGALMSIVGIAPHLLQNVYGYGPQAFGVMQIVLVAAFMVGSMAASAAAQSLGLRTTIAIGLALLGATAVLLTMIALQIVPNNPASFTLAVIPSQMGLGLRFGVSMSAAIGSVPGRASSASAMASFMCFALAALGNTLTAIWIEYALGATAVACVAFTISSFLAFCITPRDSSSKQPSNAAIS
jgi:MFS transporter, DHA1 family, multidrug resistance protein